VNKRLRKKSHRRKAEHGMKEGRRALRRERERER
jgi:hypothetical protein